MKRTGSGSTSLRSHASSKRRRDSSRIRHVVCIDNRGYPASLEKGKVYRVLPDSEGEKEGLIRVIDESGDGYLYPETRFSSVKLSRQAVRALAPGA